MTHHLVEIRRVEGKDAVCSAHIDEWSCLVLQTAKPDQIEIEMIHSEEAGYDMTLVIPSLLLESLGDKLVEVLPRLVGFAYEHEL